MPKYVFLFSYTPDAWARMIEKPGDRTAAARTVIEAAGGTLESIYFMFGERDGLAIFEAPDSQAAAAMSIAVGSSGAFSKVQTHELVAPEDLATILEKAGAARERYSPPGT